MHTPSPPRAHLRHRRPRGFTLLEILVVMVIIGLLAGVTVSYISSGGIEKEMETEARRIARLVDLAAEEAVLQARQLGLRFTDQEYSFVVYEKRQWQPLNDRLFAPRKIAKDLEIQLNTEGFATTLSTEQDAEKRATLPQIMIFSSGELTPFELTIRAFDSRVHYELIGQAGGDIEINKRGVEE